jgi:para-nitrobenzyl esterase
MIVAALACCALLCVACDPPGRPVKDPIAVTGGLISGTEEDGVRMYKGIPYAAPPVGTLRWSPPHPVKSWKGVLACDQWADRAPQLDQPGLGEVSEDCLHLNLITPAQRASEKLPVMVFFHGGGLSIHTGNSLVYCNSALPKKGVIVVTVNSRLGPLGYLSHPALTAESRHNASGNYGTMDLIASLKWVRKNIAAFGGDPGNVTIFGESGGGSKVLSVMASPLAKGLFHHAIIESGSMSAMPNGTTALAAAEAAGQKLAAKLGVDGEEDVLAAMRAKSWEEILKAAADPEVRFMANLAVDGWVLPDTVSNIFKNGQQSDVPLIVGANQGEKNELQTTVPNVAAGMSSVPSDAYVYVFSHVPTAWREQPCVAFHGLELPYVFGRIPEGLYERIVTLLAPSGGCTLADPGPDEMDVVVADQMMTLWAQFAATGNPAVEGLTEWPAWDVAGDHYLDIGFELQVKTGVAQAYVAPPGGGTLPPIPTPTPTPAPAAE